LPDQSSGSVEKIEVLSVALLDQHRQQVEALKTLARSLGIGIGWHYLLDWTWILSLLGQVEGKRIMDAGAGVGLLQWYLAGQGAEIISVDRGSRAELSIHFRLLYAVSGLRPEDLVSPARYIGKNIKYALRNISRIASLIRSSTGMDKTALPKKPGGKVIVYNQDLSSMPLIADNSIDAVVAVSALEHNSPAGLATVVDELLRVLKPGGVLLATLGAARDQDWFHEPSKGWCYTDSSLRRLFHLSADTPSNYTQYDDLFNALKNCDELRLNLADFYFHSGNNGMPWGKWDPQYQSVGVCKRK
jgi:SAM-dependent methyltransferase